MKRYVYFVSWLGRNWEIGNATIAMDSLVTNREDIRSMGKALIDSDPTIEGIVIINFILLREEETA
jgi:hypothetical protein